MLTSPRRTARTTPQDIGGTAIGQLDFSGALQQRALLVAEADRDPAVLRAHPERLPAARTRSSPRRARRCWPGPCAWMAHLCFGSRRAEIQYNGSPSARGAARWPAGPPTWRSPRARQRTGRLSRNGTTLRPGRGVGGVDRVLGGQPHHRAAGHEHQAGPPAALKLLTTSYDFQNEGVPCGAPPPPAGIGCDNAVDGNPQNAVRRSGVPEAQPDGAAGVRPGRRSRSPPCCPATAT